MRDTGVDARFSVKDSCLCSRSVLFCSSICEECVKFLVQVLKNMLYLTSVNSNFPLCARSVVISSSSLNSKKLTANLSEDNSRTQSRKVTITSAKYESR